MPARLQSESMYSQSALVGAVDDRDSESAEAAERQSRGRTEVKSLVSRCDSDGSDRSRRSAAPMPRVKKNAGVCRQRLRGAACRRRRGAASAIRRARGRGSSPLFPAADSDSGNGARSGHPRSLSLSLRALAARWARARFDEGRGSTRISESSGVPRLH